ncbi:hypothetical protein [Rhodanobacter denitrificans]|uniref:hypothetical protein n=1 Tax=Rhodanobacter denitrificans TaxID=666685 RepID=UPI001F324A2B|nr:hypothetical protein [Rhodanobacter denitrificans]UJJ60450.1 hypothetical protein LRK55_18595 [Rhodanobacter denitrificans]
MTTTLTEFNAIAAKAGQPVLNHPDAFISLCTLVGGELEDVLKLADSGNEQGVKWLARYITAARFLETLYRIGFGDAGFEQAFRVLMQQGPERARTVATAALRGDGTAKRDISQWLLNAPNGQDRPWSPTAPRTGAANGQQTEPANNVAVLSRYNRAMPAPHTPTGEVRRATPPAAQDASSTRRPEQGERSADNPRQSGHPGAQDRRPEPARSPAPSSRPESPFRSSAQQESTREAPAPRTPERGEPREYDSTHVYGGRAALEFQASTTRGNNPTVQIDAATGSNKVYNWKDKIVFQLTKVEMQLLTALLYGHLRKLHLSGHDDKWLNVEHQEGQYAGTIKFTMGKGKADAFKPRTVQLSYADMGEVHSLFIRQTSTLLKVGPLLVERVVKQVAASYSAQQDARGGQGGGQGGGYGGRQGQSGQGAPQQRYANG